MAHFRAPAGRIEGPEEVEEKFSSEDADEHLRETGGAMAVLSCVSALVSAVLSVGDAQACQAINSIAHRQQALQTSFLLWQACRALGSSLDVHLLPRLLSLLRARGTAAAPRGACA